MTSPRDISCEMKLTNVALLFLVGGGGGGGVWYGMGESTKIIDPC